MAKIGILVIDNDEASQSALRQVLDSEGWRIHVTPRLREGLAEVATGEWSLVILNIAMTGLTGPAFLVLRELALAPAVENGKARARVLFLVPETMARDGQVVLEKERLPYVLKPYEFNDLLEKISDLLMENAALTDPIRQVRFADSAGERQLKENRSRYEAGTRQTRRDTGMFAKRDEYTMTEEELAEYERTEREDQEREKKKKQWD